MEVFDIAKRIIVAVIFVPLLLVIILFLPAWCWCAAVAIISCFASFELLRAAGEGKLRGPMLWAALVSAVLIPVGQWAGWGMVSAVGCTLAVAAVGFVCAILTYEEQTGGPIRLYHVLLTLFAGCGIPLALSSVVALRDMAGGRYLVLLALLLSFVTDGAAYFGGVFLGKHRGIFPVSPKKSVEGYLCGLLGGILIALLVGLAAGAVEGSPTRPIPLILCGLLGALFNELGDLAFSLIKRQYNVKDFGKLLPGHGGMLDRFDSLIFCGPVIFLLAWCVNPMG